MEMIVSVAVDLYSKRPSNFHPCIAFCNFWKYVDIAVQKIST